MIVEAVLNARWANAEGTIIVVDVKFAHLPDFVPFAAMANDVEEHGRALFAALINGNYGSIAGEGGV